MILKELKLENFRHYKAPTSISFDEFTVLVGRNDAGKSTFLDALDIFFNDASIDKDDASVGGDPTNVTITCVFSDLPDDIILDTDHSTSLSSEYLTRQDGSLEISRVYNCTAAKGKQTAVYAHANHPTADNLDDLHSLTIAKLKTLARSRAANLEGVNETVKSEIRRAIWAQADDLQLNDQPVDLTKESGKDVWSQIQANLPIFALFKSDRASTDQDGEAQDPMKTVIKETIRQHETALQTIVNSVTAELESVANATVEKIQEMSPNLANSLSPSVKTKAWESLFSVNLSGEDGISINKRGSGTRRLILLNFFRARAENDSTTKGTGTIYAIEEPETSQHPDHQLILLDAFNEITSSGKAQVILTTHTPNLARKIQRESLRFITKNEADVPEILYGTEDTTLKNIKDALGILADHDVKLFVGVEGKWDIEFFKRISKILNVADTTIPCLASAEKSGYLVFIPLGGSSMELWTSRIAELNRPEFYITDRDTVPPALPAYQAHIDDWNARDNCSALCTSKRELENYLHPTAIQHYLPNFPNTIADFDDVPATYGQLKGIRSKNAKKILNQGVVDKMTPALLAESDPNGDITTILRTIATHLAN